VIKLQTKAGVHRKGTLTLPKILEDLRQNPDFSKAGAIATFTGVVREEAEREGKVQKLELEAYEEKANEVLTRICNDLKKRAGVIDVQIHHLLGEFNVGEDLVYVVVTGSHRKEVFSVLVEAVERYKKEAPIFKKEQLLTKNGKRKAYWVEEKESH
jgi:molybdopterin synthase catalytic subunit